MRVWTEFNSGLENGRIGGPRPVVDEDKLDLHQAFVDVTVGVTGPSAAVLRVGRQEIALGAGRMYALREGPNVPLSFDGRRGPERDSPARSRGRENRSCPNLLFLSGNPRSGGDGAWPEGAAAAASQSRDCGFHRDCAGQAATVSSPCPGWSDYARLARTGRGPPLRRQRVQTRHSAVGRTIVTPCSGRIQALRAARRLRRPGRGPARGALLAIAAGRSLICTA